METQGPRRSGRVRKSIKIHAEEQAADCEFTSSARANKRQKSLPPGNLDAAAVSADSIVSQAFSSFKISKTSSVHPKTSKVVDDQDELGTWEPTQPSRKRKVKRANNNNDWHASAAESHIAREQGRIKKVKHGASEKRLRPYVDEPGEKFNKALKAANTQRMYVIDRERSVEPDCHAHQKDCPCERIQLAGSTGNVYTVTISHLPSCTCPVGLFRSRGDRSCCKHVLYVLHHVLKVPTDLKQQSAFLTSELRDIFRQSPALASEADEDEPLDGNRKDLGDDCPICFTEFDEGEGEEITWCRASCGNNIHKGCFEQWERTKPGRVTCPFCRAPWQAENAMKSQKERVADITVPEEKKAGGYRNVRHLLEYDMCEA